MPHPFSTVIDLLAHNARSHAMRPALVFEGQSHEHAAIYQHVQAQAAALAAAGVRQGDRVLLLAGNRPEVLVLLGAVAWLGAMLVPLNLRLSPTEMAQQARDAGPALVIVDATCLPLWTAAWPEGMPGPSLTTLAPSGQGLACAGPAGAPAVARQDRPEQAVVMLYTAAVQGHARGAVLAQSQLTASAGQTAQAWSLHAQDSWLGVLPLFHAAGLGLSLALLAAGGACVLLPRFDPAAAVAAVSEHGVSVCATFAPMLGTLLDAAQASARGAAALRSLRVCMGLEPPAVLERLASLCPAADFWSAYGQAEVSSMVCMGLHRERPGAAGRALAPSQVRVQDAAGRPLATGCEGEIAVRGPTVFLGYWDAQASRPFRPADDWHRTGDLGRLDEDGWLWFTGRAADKQLIKTGGENVYPSEVEQVLLEHPAVAEAFVFGLPDQRWGEAVHAVCALRPGSKVSEAELLDHVGSRIARYKRPQRVIFRAAPLDRSAKGLP
jgi:acyl-CoA synthetase (AMP-forming)/AMP-acid ligase II